MCVVCRSRENVQVGVGSGIDCYSSSRSCVVITGDVFVTAYGGIPCVAHTMLDGKRDSKSYSISWNNDTSDNNIYEFK